MSARASRNSGSASHPARCLPDAFDPSSIFSEVNTGMRNGLSSVRKSSRSGARCPRTSIPLSYGQCPENSAENQKHRQVSAPFPNATLPMPSSEPAHLPRSEAVDPPLVDAPESAYFNDLPVRQSWLTSLSSYFEGCWLRYEYMLATTVVKQVLGH